MLVRGFESLCPSQNLINHLQMRNKTRPLDITVRVDIFSTVPEEIKQEASENVSQLFLETIFDKWFPDLKYTELFVLHHRGYFHISIVVKGTVIEHKIKGDRDTPDHYEHSDLYCDFEHSIPKELIVSISKSIEDLNP
jgi:hypothetical protein